MTQPGLLGSAAGRPVWWFVVASKQATTAARKQAQDQQDGKQRVHSASVARAQVLWYQAKLI